MMKNIYSSLFFVLAVSAFSAYAQDAPPSIGPAPLAYSLTEQSEIFGISLNTSRAFSYSLTGSTSSQLFKYFLGSPGTFTNIGPVQNLLAGAGDQCGTYGSQAIYVIQELSPYTLYTVDTVTGSLTNLGNITGILPGHSSAGITGLAWDASTITAFISSTSITESQIYTLNLSTRIATPVGSPTTTAPAIIALACNPAGSLFAIDIINDNLYKINKISGIPSVIGPLGYNANYLQDADFDPTNSVLYWAANGTGTPQLRTIDTATGASTFVSSYTGINQVLATIIPYATGPQLAHDYYVREFLSFPTQFTVNSNRIIKAKIRNIGSSNENNVPVKFYINGVQTSSVNISLNSGDVDSVSFMWAPAATGNYTLTIASALTTDMNRYNDTISANVIVLPSLSPGYTYNECRFGLYKPIPDNGNMYDSIVITSIPSNACYIADVNARIDTVVHTWDADLQFYLKHEGVEVFIIDRVGGSGDNFIGTNLNDSASIPISSGTAPFTGTYRPSYPLSAFNGYVNYAGGSWILRIFDGAGGDTGHMKAWCITVTYYLCGGGIQTITVPNYYSLKQNYPNPFNPSTKIEYAIPRSGNVKLTVYNINGREVSVILNEFKNQGIYSVDFDGSGLSSGVYFYKMQSGEFADTKKMLLLK